MHTLSRRSLLQVGFAAGTNLAFGRSDLLAQTRLNGKDLITRTATPLNAEPALQHLPAGGWITPIRHFYVRSHAPVPQIDRHAFRLKVEGLVERPLAISLDELTGAKFPVAETIATMTCAGNRRNEHSRKREVGGVQWDAGAIGNARWTGVRLSEVLNAAGLRSEARHVWFESLDEIEKNGTTFGFGGSIPVEKALSDSDDGPGALLTTGMNGEPLPPDHGAPLRMVVPGYIGARSVKWLGRIVVSDRPSPNHYVANAYKVIRDGSTLEWAEAGPIYRFPVNAAICTPQPGAVLKTGSVEINGYALPTGNDGVSIKAVDISSDGGKTWKQARLSSDSRPLCWRLWNARVTVTSNTKELIVRARDSSGRRQPQRVAWNAKGYLFNAWHRVPVSVEG